MLTFNIVLLLIGALGALAFPLIYMLGARWWTNPIGRMMVGEGVVIALVYTKSVAAVLLGAHVSSSILSTVINAVVASMLWGMSGTILHVIRKEKK